MLDSERREVVLSILDPAAVEIAKKACEALGLAHRLLPLGLASWSVTLRAVALIYDGEPRPSGLVTLCRIRSANPSLPLIGFPSMREGVVPFLTLIGETPAAFATGYWRTASDRVRLQSLLERALMFAPNIAVMQALEAILPRVGAINPREVAAAVVRLRMGGSQVSANSVAVSLGISSRALRRSWPPIFGTPKTFFDSVTMLLALYLRCWTRRGWGTIASELGTTERALRRLREGLPPERGIALKRSYMQLANSCDAPADTAARGLELLFEHAQDPFHSNETNGPHGIRATLL